MKPSDRELRVYQQRADSLGKVSSMTLDSKLTTATAAMVGKKSAKSVNKQIFAGQKRTTVSTIKVDLQKTFQYQLQGMVQGNSPAQMRERDRATDGAQGSSPRRARRKTILNKQKLLGYGVSSPNEDFMKTFQLKQINQQQQYANKALTPNMNSAETVLPKIRFEKVRSQRRPSIAKRPPPITVVQEDKTPKHNFGPISKPESTKEISQYQKKMSDLAFKTPVETSRKETEAEFAHVVELSEESKSDAVSQSSMSLMDAKVVTTMSVSSVSNRSKSPIGQRKQSMNNNFHQKKNSQQPKNNKSLNLNNVDSSLENCQYQIQKYWDQAKLNRSDRTIYIDNSVLKAMVECRFGLVMTHVQSVEAMMLCDIQAKKVKLAQKGRYQSINKAENKRFDRAKFAKWLSRNLSYMFKIGNSHFNLPAKTAQSKADIFAMNLSQNTSITSFFSPRLENSKIETIQSACNSPKNITQNSIKFLNSTKTFKTRNQSVSNTLNQASFYTQQDPIALQKSKQLIDSSCGDPYYHIKKNQKQNYIEDMKFQNSMASTFDNINKFPRLKKSIQDELSSRTKDQGDKRAFNGWMGSQRSRQNIKEFNLKIKQKESQMLDTFIRNEPKACQGINLDRLLTKEWAEGKNSWILMSKIGGKRERRIKELINQTRYGTIQ